MNGQSDRSAAVEYIHGCYRELAPAIMQLALLSQRQKALVPGKLRYLELGFGQGLSLNVHAAGAPGEYWGTDTNPAHVANARELAEASGADVHLFNQSFAEFAARDDLPEFDVIGFHGVWSWIPDEDRKAIVDILNRRLKVGGLCYVSYNAVPGWSTFMPLRHLMALHSELMAPQGQEAGPTIDGALNFAQSLADAGMLYFRANPAAAERLKQLRDQAKNYLVHEFLAADWTPMPFSDMARWMEGARLSFGASAHLLDHIDALNLTVEGQKLVNSASHVVMRESLRDYAMNQQFRRDIFVKGPRSMTLAEQGELFREMRFSLVLHQKSVRYTVKGTLDEETLHEAVYRPVVEALASRDYAAKSVTELFDIVDSKGVGFAQLFQALVVLTGMGCVQPAQTVEVAAAAAPATQRLNTRLMERALHNSDTAVMVSPVTGGAVGLSRFFQIFLRARIKAPASSKDDWAREAWSIMNAQGQRLLKDGQPLETAEENIAELNRQAEEFTDLLPLLTALGIA